MIIRFKVTLETGFEGSTHRDVREVEVDDNATQEEIEKAVEAETYEWAQERIDYWFEIIN